MVLVVQKYGGSSVGDVERIKEVCRRIQKTIAAGDQVVVVVSAMGKTTDDLVSKANAILGDLPAPPRELDLLLSTGEQVSIALVSMALQKLGVAAIALTGAQVGMITEPCYNRARILEVKVETIDRHLKEGKVVVVAGFQGISKTTGDITTLGRGGSDTSAVAIAAALNADRCEIYTDVPGVLSTDPRLIANASLLTEISCDEMLELASAGAKVLHPRAVEIARNFNVPLVVRSSWSEHTGTLIITPGQTSGDRQAIELNRCVESIQVDHSQAKIALLEVPDRPGIAAQLFSGLAAAGIVVDLIVQSIQHPHNYNNIAFTVPRNTLGDAQNLCQNSGLHPRSIVSCADITILSITGVGIVGQPDIVAQMFNALASANINIQMISTSETKVSCVITEAEADRGVEVLQAVYGVPKIVPTASPLSSHIAPVRGVALDQKQTRLALIDVPDRPGVAAQLLQQLANQGICLDMIIQSQSDRGVNDIALTISSGDRGLAQQTLESVAQKLQCGQVLWDNDIAKVSIVGMAMAQTGGVAAQMFRALAEENINIEMIATSEIRVSCVVRQEAALKALKVVHSAFQLAGDTIIPVEKG